MRHICIYWAKRNGLNFPRKGLSSRHISENSNMLPVLRKYHFTSDRIDQIAARTSTGILLDYGEVVS